MTNSQKKETMNLRKQISYLFRLNRDDFNRADRKIEKVLREVFEKGRKAGIKENKKSIMSMVKKYG